MAFSDEEQRELLERQVFEWTAEMQRLASQITAARGKACAVVVITPHHEDYEDVAPELIMEDAFGVRTYGWPDGFDVDLLNTSK